MGFAYTELIPPAILYLNPGVNREEFCDLLGGVESWDGEIPLRGYTRHELIGERLVERKGKFFPKWDLSNLLSSENRKYLALLKDFNPDSPEERFLHFDTYLREKGFAAQEVLKYLRIHETSFYGDANNLVGIHGLARILGLSLRPEFKTELRKINQTYGGIVFGQISNFRPFCRRIEGKWSEPEYKFEINDLPSFGDEEEISIRKYDFIEGDRILPFRNFIVNHVVERKEKEVVLSGQEFNLPRREVRFANLRELTSRFPFFDPDKMYDFSKSSGNFSQLHKDPFNWFRQGDKYYFDDQFCKENVGGGIVGEMYGLDRRGFFGYTDLMMTVEAIRKRGFKLLTYHGLNHIENFFRRNPDSRAKHAKTCWDVHTSLYAKKQKMTNFELLRMRLLAPVARTEARDNFGDYSYLDSYFKE